MSDILIVPAHTTELIEKARVFVVDSFIEMGSQYDPDGRDSDLRDIHASYAHDHGQLFIGLSGYEPVVIATSAVKRISDEIAEIKRVRVAADQRGKGYGEVMLRVAVKWAINNGYSQARLDTRPNNKVALHLFDSAGFLEQNRTNNKVVMTKDLKV